MPKILITLVCGLFICCLYTPVAAAATLAETKAMFQNYYEEIWNQNKSQLAEKYFASTGIEHDPMMDPKLTPLENIQTMMKMMHTGFPDLHFQVKDILVDGDKVAVRYRLTGTHKGSFMGIASTGKTIDVEGVELHRLANGKIVEHWGFFGLFAAVTTTRLDARDVSPDARDVSPDAREENHG